MEELKCTLETFKQWRDVFDGLCTGKGHEVGRTAKLSPDDLNKFLSQGEGKSFKSLHAEDNDRSIYTALMEAGKSKPLNRDQFLRIVFGISEEKLEIAEDFISLDLDGSGGITKDELMQKFSKEKAEEYLSRHDLDENGTITLQELWQSNLPSSA